MAESTTRSAYPNKAELQRRENLDLVRRRANEREEKRLVESRTVLSASLERLASRLGKSADELARCIPTDTLKRLRVPVNEHDNEDGTVEYKPLPDIIPDGRKGLVQK